MKEFRYFAGKAVVADFTSIPFSDEGLLEWRQSMRTVFGNTTVSGFEARRGMSNSHREALRLDAARRAYGADYAVIHEDTPWEYDVLAEVGDLRIVPIGP